MALERVSCRRGVSWLLCPLLVSLLPAPADAEIPSLEEVLKLVDLSAAEIQRAEAGEFVTLDLKPSNERELTAAFAFLVDGATPTELVQRSLKGSAEALDPTTQSFGIVEGEPDAADFAELVLEPDGAKRALAFTKAEAGGDLYLSKEEIATFAALGSKASQAQVEGAVRDMLLARMRAYREKGLAGIAPYAKGGGEARSPAEDLRAATKTLRGLREQVPAAYQLLLDYPVGKPDGLEESFRWSQILANDVPTLVLSHYLYVPDGDAWLVVQRQFYVSTGYNCEQAVAVVLPVDKGAAFFYANRTSTDQVTGFGGGAKRSIGSKVLASQLKSLFERSRKRLEQD